MNMKGVIPLLALFITVPACLGINMEHIFPFGSENGDAEATMEGTVTRAVQAFIYLPDTPMPYDDSKKIMTFVVSKCIKFSVIDYYRIPVKFRVPLFLAPSLFTPLLFTHLKNLIICATVIFAHPLKFEPF